MSRKFIAFDIETAADIPGNEPDTSWMDKPIPRKNFAAWLSG
jgi:hypothetical protein